MSTAHVTTLFNTVNPTIDDARKWQPTMEKRYPLNTIRLRVAAFDALVETLEEQESRGIDEILEKLPEMHRRLGFRNPNLNGDTLRTYESRMRSMLLDFKEYLNNPGFVPRSRATNASASNEDARKKKTKEPRTEETAAPESRTEATAAQPPPGRDREPGRDFVCPLDDDRLFEFRLPPEFCERDLRKVAWMLMGLTKDFNPTSGASFFGLTRS